MTIFRDVTMEYFSYVHCIGLFKILDAMNRDCGIPLSHLQVDGGMTNNKILMQLQADILYIPVG